MTDIDDHRDRYDDDHDPEPPDDPTLADLLAQYAEGTFGAEAAIWLLDQHGHWIDELDRLDLIRVDSTGYSFIRWDEISEARPVGTGSEIQVLTIAHALATASGSANGVTSFRGLTSLDETNRRLVLHAVAWAMAGRDWAESLNLVPALTKPWAAEPVGGYSDKSPF